MKSFQQENTFIYFLLSLLAFTIVSLCSVALMTLKLNASSDSVSDVLVRILSVHTSLAQIKIPSFLHPGSRCIETKHTCQKMPLWCKRADLHTQTSRPEAFLEMPKRLAFPKKQQKMIEEENMFWASCYCLNITQEVTLIGVSFF